jgi:hypothetical protein
MNENVIGKEVVDAAVKVHRELGTGLLETVYEVVLTQHGYCEQAKPLVGSARKGRLTPSSLFHFEPAHGP